MIVRTRVVFSGSAGSSDPNVSLVVVVDLPEELLTGDLEAAEVVLSMRIVASVEVCEALNSDQPGLSRQGQVCDA